MMENAQASAKADKAARRATRLARILVLYGLLVGGSAVFTLPFLWMIGTSFKVDREMFSEQIRIMPMRPVPAQASPYLDTRYFKPPQDKDLARFEKIRPAIETSLKAWDLPVSPRATNFRDFVEILAPGIFWKMADILPEDTWALPEDQLYKTVRSKIDQEIISSVSRRVSRELAFGTVRVRSFELQEKAVSEGNPISSFWNVTANVPATLDENPYSETPEAVLAYDFEDADKDEPIILSSLVDLPFKQDRLFRTQISIRPDDTWHRIEFYLEKGGIKYHGTRPEFMGDFQPTVVTLQEYGPDDLPDANKIKLWIAYKEVDRSPAYDHGENKVKVTMAIHRNSQAGAWWAKCYRNYRGALNYIPFWRYLSTSVLLVLLNIIGNIFSCSLVAYAFARLHWPGRNICFGIMLATMMIPPQVTMIPFFLIMKHMGLYNTLTPLWLISFFGNAFNVFLLRQFMKGIPRDLEDAAKIDGCNFLQIYWYVMMPLIKPTLACIAIFTFMAVWNDFMGPLIFLSDQRLYPLSLGLYALNVQQAGNFGMLMAGSLLMTLPVILIFFFAQRYFIQGITLTGTKG